MFFTEKIQVISSLYIKNLAIIDELSIEFDSGLNIITGETGSGKSIIMSALSYIRGGRFSKDHMRYDSNRTVLEATFNQGVDEYIIRRIITANGQSKIFCNDEPIKLSRLSSLTAKFFDLHGQHEHQKLLDVKSHLHYLDAYAHHPQLLESVSTTFQKLEDKKNVLAGLKQQQSELNEKRELFEFQLKELSEFEISVGIDSKLDNEYMLLNNAYEIQKLIYDILQRLSNSDESIESQIANVGSSLQPFASSHESLEVITNRIESLKIEAGDIASELNNLKSVFIIDEERLEIVNQQLSHVEMLKRKYGGSIESVLAYKTDIENQLLEDASTFKQIPLLEQECKKIQVELNNHCLRLTASRQEAAQKLENEITTHVMDMDMESVEFKIKFNSINPCTEFGSDICEFFINTNVGEELKPLAKIASGGEISRIMLAIKLALQNSDTVDTLIFDEIDSGISGATAEKVGNKINQLGKSHQVLCISHLSQIAGMGDSHYKVSKHITNDRTKVSIYKLDKEERINEIASLISGKTLTESSLKQAEYLIERNYG